MTWTLAIIKSRETKGKGYYWMGIDFAEGYSPEGTLAIREEISYEPE
jgi:hypothetical protein